MAAEVVKVTQVIKFQETRDSRLELQALKFSRSGGTSRACSILTFRFWNTFKDSQVLQAVLQ
jgi:hypothetical protein